MKSTLDVCQRLDFEAQVYGEYSQSINKFSQALWNFIACEVDTQSALFSPLCQILDDFSGCNSSICKEIRRAIEDLRDITERNVVIQRKILEHALLIKQYENSKLKVADAKKNYQSYESRPDFYMKKESLENSIREFENEQRESTLKARDGTLYLIEEKKKFANFTTRRIKSCFERLGNAFKTNSEQSIILLNRFIEGLNAIKNDNPMSNFVLYGQDTIPDDINSTIKTSVITENENEYILCEKSIDTINSDQNQNHNNEEVNSNNDSKNNNSDEPTSTTFNPSANQSIETSTEIIPNASQEENHIMNELENSSQNINNSDNRQEEIVSNQDNFSFENEDIVSIEIPSKNPAKKDSSSKIDNHKNENLNDDSNAQEENNLNEKNEPPSPEMNE